MTATNSPPARPPARWPLAALLLAATPLLARAADDLTVLRGEGAEWVVSYQGQPVCVYVAEARPKKPYVRLLAPPGGKDLLRDAPHDHLHHHGLMYAIRVDGVNFWEETSGCGVQSPVGDPITRLVVDTSGHARAVIWQTIHWRRDGRPQDTPPLLEEERVLSVRVDPPSRSVLVVWQSALRVPEDGRPVILDGARYNGLGARFRHDLDAVATPLVGGQPVDLAGKADDVRPGPWGAMVFRDPHAPATLVLAASPRNTHARPARYFAMLQPFPYLAATQGLDEEPFLLRPGEALTLKFLAFARAEAMTPEAIDAVVSTWAPPDSN
jgi:hypothetical protein